MKNITVSVDDDVYHRARVRAAELNTSVSALVRQHLEQLSREETEMERLQRREAATLQRIRRRGLVFRGANRLTREEVHDRHAVSLVCVLYESARTGRPVAPSSP